MHAGLRDAVEMAYAVFDRPAPSNLGVCTDCCMDPENERLILSGPVRGAPLEAMRDWSMAAFSGEAPARAPIRYLFPRLLELFADGADVHPIDDGLTFRRMAESGYPDGWTEREIAAVDRAFSELVLLPMSEDPRVAQRVPLDEMIKTAALANVPLGPLFGRIEAAPSPGRADALMACTRGLGICRGGFVDAFWADAPEPRYDEAVRWFTDPARAAELEAAFFADPPPSPARAEELSRAEAILRTWSAV